MDPSLLVRLVQVTVLGLVTMAFRMGGRKFVMACSSAAPLTLPGLCRTRVRFVLRLNLTFLVMCCLFCVIVRLWIDRCAILGLVCRLCVVFWIVLCHRRVWWRGRLLF